jgi:hypothetical protein
MMPPRAAELAIAAALAIAAISAGNAPTLAVQGDRFTVNGRPAFLVLVSYFDGVRRISDSGATTVLDADLDYFVRKGVSGLRVFPNWQFPADTLMQCDGTLRPVQLEKLKTFLDRAAEKGLVVDVSFTIDTVKSPQGSPCLSASAYNTALQAATAALAGRPNLLFDLQNEHDKNLPPPDAAHPRGWTAKQWEEYLGATVRRGVKARDPSRLTTVSWTSDAPAATVVSSAQSGGYDVLAYHNRGDGWEQKTLTHVATLKSILARRPPPRPIYLQEPNRFPFDTDPAHYETAMINARRAGAAAWTFHNSVVEQRKPLNGATPFEELLEPGERAFLDRLSSIKDF